MKKPRSLTENLNDTISGAQLRELLIMVFGDARWQQDAAAYFGVHPATVRRWCASRRIPRLTFLVVEQLEAAHV